MGWGFDLTFFKNLQSNSLPTGKSSPPYYCLITAFAINLRVGGNFSDEDIQFYLLVICINMLIILIYEICCLCS